MSSSLRVFDSLDSTNNYLKQHYHELENMTFVCAKYQTSGRGQFDRTWQSDKGKNLLVSFLIKALPTHEMPLLQKTYYDGLVSYVKTFVPNVYLKEPNDLYVNDKKIAGILIETLVSDQCYKYVIIGLGLNVNQIEFSGLCATSIAIETNHHYDIQSLLSTYVTKTIENLGEHL